MDSWLKHYIPAGCLRMRANGDDDLPPEAWITSYLEDWAFLIRHNDLAINHEVLLPDAAQTALLGSSVLVPFVDLFNARWIQISYSHGIIRVYIFPHDVDRRSIVRAGDAKLSKSLASLLRQLDYSPDTWNGTPDAVVWNHPATDTDRQYVVDEDCSLLERFNQLPSPEPQLDLITKGSFNAYALQGIMESSLSGLHTTLFAHQRRSAAVMLQREVEPGHVVDPRLRRAVDQTNQPWYFDTHTGLVLKEPRLYDQVSGGILAEEMGTGKTLICLALILATKDVPTEAPDALMVASSIRRRTGSLLDMAAAAVNRYSFPWKDYLASDASDSEKFYPRCVRALVSKENRAYYELGNPLVEIRRGGRIAAPKASAQRIYLSSVSLIIVPNNLVTQWELEISKHTTGLKCLTMTESQHDIPPVSVLLGYDIILFSQARFERIERTRTDADGRPVAMHCPLEHMRFKRCVVDEGHKLGSAKGSAWKSDLMRGLGRLQIAARWVVTGTPSRGLYSVQGGDILRTENKTHSPEQGGSQAVSIQEREDLQRIGSIASKFLNVRPWSNTREEVGDTPANWNVYVLQPKHHNKSYGRIDCLKTTLESLIIRNRLSDVSHHLPLVHEKIVVLDGSFQDKLSLNLFSMMIIFNSVQSQRTDQDYFFHPRQRKAVDQLVSNLRQASFFGGVFFSVEEIKKSLETAQSFLKEEKVSLSPEDHQLLESAIEFGNLAVENQLKTVSALYHSMPLYIDHFPGGKGKHWSLDDADTGTDEPICTDASLVKQLQKTLNPCIDAPTSLKVMIDSGQLDLQGDVARERVAREAAVASDAPVTSKGSLAGNTLQGIDRHDIKKANVLLEASRGDVPDTNTTSIEIAEPLAKTRIISTVSSKLTYLIDCITKYQEEEQIIVFYDSDNVAWYLAGVLEIVSHQSRPLDHILTDLLLASHPASDL